MMLLLQEWTRWYSWEPCTIMCGGGTHYRQRGCTFDGTPVPVTDCTGFSGQTEECNTHSCEPPAPCPADNYFIHNHNESCCKYYNRKYDPDVNPEFNGSPLLVTDPVDYCKDGAYLECPNVPILSTCYENPDGQGIIQFLILNTCESLSTTLSFQRFVLIILL